MKKMLAVLILGLVGFCLYAEEVKAFDQCSGTYKTYTSEMNKKSKVHKIKESKLTSLRYLKKISTLVSTEKVQLKSGKYATVYKFKSEGIEGFLRVDNKTDKMGMFKVDGKIYGRFEVITHKILLKRNLHDPMAKQRSHIVANYEVIRDGVKYDRTVYTKFTKHGLNKRSRLMKDTMLEEAKEYGLFLNKKVVK